MKIISSLLCFFTIILLSSAVSAYEVNTTSSGKGIKWDASSVTYYINTSGGPTNASTALQSAMQTWTDVSTSSFSFVYGGTTTSTLAGEYDGSNIITFGSMGTTGTLAQNTSWYSSITGNLLDSDIEFNTDYLWATDGGSTAYDVQNVATHEYGHSLSLADLYSTADAEKTMYGYASKGETKKRTLDQDDIDGISYLYPGSSSSPNLTPYKPGGWSDKIVVSTLAGTTTDGTTIRTTDNIYIDWAVTNNGTSNITTGYYTALFVDRVVKKIWDIPSLNANYYSYVKDYSLGSLSAGTHKITIVTDPTRSVSESNEYDNFYTKTITVTSKK